MSDSKGLSKKFQFVVDGWTNVLTNLGVLNKDKRTGGSVEAVYLTREDVDNLYGGDDIAARIIDRLPEEMTREGFKVTAEGFEDLSEDCQKYFERYDLDSKIEQALKWARMYGGAAIIVGVADGSLGTFPVNFQKINKIEYFTVLDRWRFAPQGESDLDGNIASNNFGKPNFYTVQNFSSNNQQILQKIHYSRVVRVDGAPVPWNAQSGERWWGTSILSRLRNAISNYQQAHDSAAVIVQDFTQLTVKLKNISDMLAQGDDEAVQKRLALLAATSSVINAVVVEEGEEVERKSTAVTGLPEMLKLIGARLVAATDLPHTILLGESASGLGATGESEKRDWYDYVKNQQESILRPILTNLFKFIFLAKDGPTKGVMPADYTIEFNPLWLPTEKEMVETRNIQAKTDEIYINASVLDPDEVAENRFGGGKYSYETALNMEERAAINKQPPANDPNSGNVEA